VKRGRANGPYLLAAALCAAVLLAPTPSLARRFRVPKQTHQLVLVIADSFTAGQATLQRFERGDKGPWKKLGEPVAVVLGRSGLGWGYGLHPDDISMERAGPLKQEGDGRSPAGVFRLSEALGYAPTPPPGTKLPYRESGPQLRCIDDPRAKEHYNTLVDEPENGKPAWSSAEHMRREDDLYSRVIVVDHNKKPIVPGQGSCIFLHVWGGPQATTSGCTAMPLADVEALMAWLDPAAQPLLVQLTRKDYQALAGPWKLP